MAVPGGNLGTAQLILPLKNQRGLRPRKGEMSACPALLKPRSATRTRLKIVHCCIYDLFEVEILCYDASQTGAHLLTKMSLIRAHSQCSVTESDAH